ncbi:MAG: GNAT family N-acetyltransferase [Pseudomonadota bacterium]
MFFIRSVTEADLPRVQALLKDSWMRTYAPHEGEAAVKRISDDIHAIRVLKEQMERPHSEFILADDGTDIGGTGYAYMRGEDEAYVQGLHVTHAVHGQGVGSDLLSELETSFPAARRVTLNLHPKNETAASFYTKRGYVEIAPEVVVHECHEMPNRTFTKKLDGWEL